jgi:hypothetical protein
MSDAMTGHSAMSDHMAWSDTRPATDADRERTRQIVKILQSALSRYKDYHVAEALNFQLEHVALWTGARVVRLSAVAGGAVAGLLGRLCAQKLDAIGGRDLVVGGAAGPLVDAAVPVTDDWPVVRGRRRRAIHFH